MTSTIAPKPSNSSDSINHSKLVKPLGTGRRKCAVARVQLIEGKGRILINAIGERLYLQDNPAYLQAVKAPLFALARENRHDIILRRYNRHNTIIRPYDLTKRAWPKIHRC